ncbi:MAG: hypothetical protein IPQ07_07690 [Myxococcales bacterium]|nr:hypothetical protein [Myxococcales bacterium]
MLQPSAVAVLALGAVATLGGCPGPRSPRDRAADPSTLEIGRDAMSLRGIASDGVLSVVALAAAGNSTIEARRGTQLQWQARIAGTAGPLAQHGSLVFVTLSGSGTVADRPIRGEPGAMVLVLDAASGAPRWQTAIESSEWATIGTLVGTADGVIVGGAFSGTLRIGSSVVSSAGKSDGFVARLGASGQPGWVVRIGGPGADSIQGVDARDGRVAIAGTFAPGGELHGIPLPAFDERAPYADGFVAELDDRTGARKWAASFGGKLDDSVAGVAIDAGGRIVVAANARDTVHVGGLDLVAQGEADGLVAWWTKDGAASHAQLIGGADFDGLRAITAVGDRVVVAGFFSGALPLGDRSLTAGGGDDAFVAALDAHGSVVGSWQVGGPGREEITALGSVPGGWIAGVAHTAATTIAGTELAAPKDPMGGAAIVVRPVR